MEREKKDILISDLIYKSLTDALKGNEADILEAWLRHPENAKFYMELKNSGRLYDGLLDMQYTETDEAWQGLSSRVAGIRRRRRLRWLSVCAACLLLGITGIWLFRENTEESATRLARATVIRKDAPVTLKRETGEVLYLEDSVKTLILPREEKRGVGADEKRDTMVRVEERVVNNVLTTSAGSTPTVRR